MIEPDPPVLTWSFPLPRTHTGILLGNGVQGVMVWGDTSLNITVGRAGFWDHRGGNAFASRTTYAQVRALLESGDEAGLRHVFANPPKSPGEPAYPTQVGGGRVELHFGGGFRPVRGVLDTSGARLHITLEAGMGRQATVSIRQAMDQELTWVELDTDIHGEVSVEVVPTWEYVGEQLAAVGCEPPELLASPSGGGFCQRLPADDPLALAWERSGDRVTITTALGPDAADGAQRLARGADVVAARQHADAWWREYWEDVPRVRLPDDVAQHAWDYGIYKLAGLTTPGGVPASLQGPWLEEYQLPPWSSDYHFNINIQMIYGACLPAGRFDHFWPLWEMIAGWLPRLRENASGFFGVPDALMMPHAVDDRCAAVGSFWTGMIDQACTAWVAQMAWMHYRYSMDERVLREAAWPLLTGAFNGYWAMLESIEDSGPRLSLPVSVSPEYNGAEMNAWGRDASFQLAALHFLAQTLPQAARIIHEPEDPRWARVRDELPDFTLTATEHSPRIGLWEGQDLDVSHRHHSHLAAIYPFRTIDPHDPAYAAVVRNSINHWVLRGAGAWSGWCVPWAVVLWLHWWKDVFTNEGHGTLHNAFFPGASVIGGLPPLTQPPDQHNREIMQMDAGMGAVTAVQELLAQCRGETIVVLPSLPRRWQELEFDGIWVEGAFRIGATVEEGRMVEVRVQAPKGGHLKLAHGIAGMWTAGAEPQTGPLLEIEMEPGQRITVRPAS